MRIGTARVLLLALAMALIAPSTGARASVVIYRCTDAFGALTVQNDVPCPKGSRQQKQVIEPPPPMPAYRPVAPAVPEPPPPVLEAAAAAAPEPAAPAIADADRLPPPPLFQCNTYDNDSYLSEDAEPAPRCVRLETTGLDGNADSAAGQACQMVTDQCQRIADGAVCEAWKQRLRQDEAAWKFGRADTAEASRVEYERVLRIVRESTCGR